MKGDKANILAILYPGCIEYEIMLAVTLVGETYPIKVAALSGQSHKSLSGITYGADLSYEEALGELSPQSYKGILVPGGDTYDVFENTALSDILRKANNLKLPIGAICAGPLLLAKAGILKERRFVHGFGDHYQEFLTRFWEGAIFCDEPVVIDGNIITAKAEAHIDFAVEFARATGVVTQEQELERLRNYYRGKRLPVAAL